jgi:phytanoyl-CoA hydroxylase
VSTKDVIAREVSTEDVIAGFRRDGYARAGVLCPPEALAALRTRIDEIMLGQVSYPGMFFQKDVENGQYEDLSFGKGYEGPSKNYRKIEKLELDPLYLSWIESEALREFVQTIVGNEVVLYRALVFNKAAETGGSHLPWHQDGGRFWGLDREPTLQIWTALDDASEDGGCLEIVPGSHLAGLATPLGGVVPKHLLEREQPDANKILLPARAGEVILIHNHVWHRSARSTTGLPRRALTVCYMSAETRCLRKKRAPRVFHPVFQRLR